MANELIYKSDARRAILKADPYVSFCIDNIKPVDAVEVVRCKDCKHCKKYRNRFDPTQKERMLCKRIYDFAYGVEAADFCSYGEKSSQITEQTTDALVKMGENAHGEVW